MFNQSFVWLILTGVAYAGSIADPQTLLYNRQSRLHWTSGRVVGGSNASPGQFPHQVSQRLFGTYHMCAGSIIASRWVVTAAQCTNGYPMDLLSIAARAYHISEDSDSYEISSIIVHQEYDDENLFNDISLIKVQRPFLLSNRVAIIGFGSAYPIGVGITARASGWGSLEVSIVCVLINKSLIWQTFIAERRQSRIFAILGFDNIRQFGLSIASVHLVPFSNQRNALCL